ncbi:MAG: Lrp/AsnC family transcriptional regulator [Candidatus Thermoplasmatota archaeon]|jgi:DNA-binding Lrp family transcriptional regulator|nr:Lrp/AsnC family transcriptional regulator [Candidatus Thermoplasmatota archaeon]MCL5964077.1 Lrp/AsnC family transcriptional regulator [Candidatus Thermoplasmatota archaeon]
MKYEIDNIDNIILSQLEMDSRITSSNLSRKLNIPRTTIQFRIKKLIDNGIIKNFTIKKDFSKMGMDASAFVLISYDPSSGINEKEVAKSIGDIEEVESVDIISGEYDLLVKIRARNVREIGSIVVDRLHSIKGVSRTVTLSSFFSIK